LWHNFPIQLLIEAISLAEKKSRFNSARPKKVFYCAFLYIVFRSCKPAGDVGINPDSGHYRLSGEVAGVEVNELRKTLGVRPTPYSVGGAVRGVLHVTGPLDQPIFSGTLE